MEKCGKSGSRCVFPVFFLRPRRSSSAAFFSAAFVDLKGTEVKLQKGRKCTCEKSRKWPSDYDAKFYKHSRMKL